MITQEILKETLRYEPDSGVFTWKVERRSHGGNVKVGQVAGHVRDNGYVIIGLNGRIYRAHRLAWLYMTGQLPDGYVDHKNGVRWDNRWANLRILGTQQNAENTHRPHKDNRLGLLGVTESFGKYEARICAKGVRYRVGRFETPQEAHLAYLRAKADLHEAWVNEVTNGCD